MHLIMSAITSASMTSDHQRPRPARGPAYQSREIYVLPVQEGPNQGGPDESGRGS